MSIEQWSHLTEDALIRLKEYGYQEGQLIDFKQKCDKIANKIEEGMSILHPISYHARVERDWCYKNPPKRKRAEVVDLNPKNEGPSREKNKSPPAPKPIEWQDDAKPLTEEQRQVAREKLAAIIQTLKEQQEIIAPRPPADPKYNDPVYQATCMAIYEQSLAMYPYCKWGSEGRPMPKPKPSKMGEDLQNHFLRNPPEPQ